MKNKVLERLGLFSWVLTLVTLAISLTIHARWLYQLDIGFLDLTQYTALSAKELMKNFDQLMHYLLIPWQTTLKMSDFPVSTSGALHFFEVKKLFWLNDGLLILSLVPSGFYLRYLVKNRGLWRLIQPFKIAFLVPIVVGGVMLVDFQDFFVRFHQLFFNNDAWLFDPVTDPIITVLPEEFFLHCFLFFFLLLEIFFLSQVMIGKRALKKER